MIQLGFKEDLVYPRPDIFPGRRKGGERGRERHREGRKEGGRARTCPQSLAIADTIHS